LHDDVSPTSLLFIAKEATKPEFLVTKSLNGDSNRDLCDAGAVLNRLTYQANWEQVVIRVYDQIHLKKV